MKTEANESTIFNTFLKIGTFSIAVLSLLGGMFLTINSTLAEKTDKTVFNEFKNKQEQEHLRINKRLETNEKILIKLELMADIYLQKNNKGE